MVVETAIVRAIAAVLEAIARAILWTADVLVVCARFILRLVRALRDRAREWDPRLWDRDHDPRSDTRERRP